MKTLISYEEESLANEVYELAKMLPYDVLRDFKIMMITAKTLCNDKGA